MGNVAKRRSVAGDRMHQLDSQMPVLKLDVRSSSLTLHWTDIHSISNLHGLLDSGIFASSKTSVLLVVGEERREKTHECLLNNVVMTAEKLLTWGN